MINNFEIIDNYKIPKDILVKLTKVYKNIGKSDILLNTLGNNFDIVAKNCLETDVFYLLEIIKNEKILDDLTDNRVRLLISKDSNPKNKSEKIVTGVKNVLNIIRSRRCEKFNSADILDFLKYIFGNNIKFNTDNIKETNKLKDSINMTKRRAFDIVIDNYFLNLQKDEYEKIMLSMIMFLEIRMIKPFKITNSAFEQFDINKIASFICLYYMLLYCNCNSFLITSLFEQLFTFSIDLENAIKVATINYGENYFRIHDLTLIIYDFIIRSYDEVDQICSKAKYEEDSSKEYNVINTIYSLEREFTKEDIRKYHPYVSDSTIMRALKKLKDDNIIIPLSKGRSAVWYRTIDDNDPKRFIR